MSDFDDFDFEPFDEDDADDADILDDYEDDGDEDERPSLTQDEMFARVDAYKAKSKENMRIIIKPKQFDKDKRLEAIHWLGEAGNPEAIPALLKVYHKDKTPGMKEEAEYALGQLKALELEYDDLEIEQDARDRIDDIILYSKFGKRANANGLIVAEVLLVILAIILFGVGFFLNQTVAVDRENTRATSVSETQTAQPTPTPDTEDLVQSQLQDYYEGLVADANFFQQQLAVSTREESIDCDTTLANPASYTLSSMWEDNPQLSAIVSELNGLRGQMEDVRSAYTTACSTLQPIPRAEALNFGTTILSVQQGFNLVRDLLNSAGIEVEEQVFMTSTPAPVATSEDPLATATVDTSDITIPILELERLIDQMTDLQGATTRTVFNWQQIVDTEQLYLSGCNQPEPTVPNDYVLATGLAGTSANLDSAVLNVNTGLQLTRAATNAFYAACDSGELPENAQAFFDQASLANTAFTSASNNLNILQGR